MNSGLSPFPVIMTTERMFYPEAVPAPLRISKGFKTQTNREVSLESWASRCHTLSKLPSQPVFDHPENRDPDTAQMQKACKCFQNVTSPITSPTTSPTSPRFSSSSSRSAPSRDFSSLFMRSPTLRLQLEKCTCHQTGSTRGAPVDRDSTGSGCASIYTC